MKNLVILGASRAGKTTLSREINKIYPNYHIISGDAVRDAFSDTLPQNNINANEGVGMKEDFPKFLGSLFNKLCYFNRNTCNYVIETCDVSVENAIKYFQKDSVVIVFLGYSELTKQEAFEKYRKYESQTDWTRNQSDEYMLNHAEKWIEKSKIFEKDCKKYNIQYIDTSNNRKKVLNNLIEQLKQELK